MEPKTLCSVKLIDKKTMKFIKIRSIEILTNGCLNLSSNNLKQITVYEKDYKNLTLAKKLTKEKNLSFSHNLYKSKYRN